MIKETPIVLPTEMVTAILDGRKTQTRQVIYPQPPSNCIDEEPCIQFDHGVERGSFENPVWYAEWECELIPGKKSVESHVVYSPYGKPGDVLWVRETWFSTRFDCNELLDCGITNHIRFKADNNYDPKKDCVGRSWKTPISMPKSAARIWLKIINVRVERLHDISESDAIAEGIQARETGWKVYGSKNVFTDSAIGSFSSYWQFRFGITSLKSNPWVWVIEFERIEKP